MEGVFVSIIMNGVSTWVHIRQFASGDGIMLSTIDFAALMFQLRAIERSFLEHAISNVHTSVVETSVVETSDVSIQVVQTAIAQTEVVQPPSTQPPVAETPKAVQTGRKRKDRSGTKGELRVRLKKTKLTKNNGVVFAFATVLRGHIDGMVRSQCLGCTLNLYTDHDLCRNPKAYVEQFFNSAMIVLEDEQVQEVMNEQRLVYPKLPDCPSKTVVQTDIILCERIKNMIINM